MKKVIISLSVLVFTTFGLINSSFAADMLVFNGDGCPHCAVQAKWINEYMNSAYPQVVVDAKEVWNDQENMDTFIAEMEKRGEVVTGVPTTIIGDDVIVGTQFELIKASLYKHFGAEKLRIEDAQDKKTKPNTFRIADVKQKKKEKVDVMGNLAKEVKQNMKTESLKAYPEGFYSQEMFHKSITRYRSRFSGNRYNPSDIRQNMTKLQWLNYINR